MNEDSDLSAPWPATCRPALTFPHYNVATSLLSTRYTLHLQLHLHGKTVGEIVITRSDSVTSAVLCSGKTEGLCSVFHLMDEVETITCHSS